MVDVHLVSLDYIFYIFYKFADVIIILSFIFCQFCDDNLPLLMKILL